MLYVIDNNYYIKIGRKYIKVDLDYKDNDLVVKSNKNDFIEDNGSLSVTTKVIDDDLKNYIKSLKSKSDKTEKYMRQSW